MTIPGLDNYKLSTPPEPTHCFECENELDKHGDCSRCQEKEEQDKIEAAEIAAIEAEEKNNPENMDNIRDIFFQLIENDKLFGVIEKQHAKSVFASAEIQLSMNQLRKSTNALRQSTNKHFRRK